jgi:tyrosyl-tRNA synthetase
MTIEKIARALSRNTETVAPVNGLEEKLALAEQEKRPLRIKLGFDPTAPDLHLGHAVVLRKIKEFQDLGHQIVLVVGGFTARIGDPTGRNKMRPPLGEDEIRANAQTYLEQFGKIVDISRVVVRNNSEWLDKLTPVEFLKLMSSTTVSQILQRTDFNERYKNQTPIGMHELLYPLLQAYDSVQIKADVELGGSDQLFNCMLGRELQSAVGQKPQLVMCMPLLVGLDGKDKMSKSKGNYIGLIEEPDNIYGKVMSIPDALMPNYIDLASDLSGTEKDELKVELATNAVNPMDVKKKIAKNITAIYSSAEAAEQAERVFQERFQRRQLSEQAFQDVSLEVLNLKPNSTLLDLCHAMMPTVSRSQIRRLFDGNAFQLDGETETNPLTPIPPDKESFCIKIGKRGFYRVLKS